MTEPSLPATPALDGSVWRERGICYVIVAWSAAFVLMPSVRSIQPANFIAGVLFIGWGARWLIRDKRNGLLGMSPAQLYQAAKSGRRLGTNPLETGAIAAFGLTIAVQTYTVWP